MKGLFHKATSGLRLPRIATCLALVAAGLAPAHSQITDPDEITEFWFDWMVLPPSSGPRLYITTERDILQTSPTSAEFESGSTQFVLADGAVGRVWRDQIIPFFEEWDTDRDGWRDDVESTANPPSNPFDPSSNPTNVEPDVFWTVLANGLQLPVNLAGSSAASLVTPFAAPNVKLIAAPAASRFPRPLTFFEYSTQFFVTNVGAPSPQLFGLALHAYQKDYPTPSQVGFMENDLVPGSYQVQFPTISNPNVAAGLWVGHNKVPNGEFTIGLRRPTWLLRSAEVFETFNKPPVAQPWINGRLRFDPNIATIFKWDNIVAAGLASAFTDRMAVWIEDEERNLIWPPTGASAELSVANPQGTLTFPGILPAISPGNPAPPLPVNGFMVLRYSRGQLGTTSGDFSKVFLRVPIEMVRGYASWKNSMFPGAAANDESISGPNADPDGDGLTNQQEYEQGSDPTRPTVGVANPTSDAVTTNSATLGATVQTDPFSGVVPTIFERGIIYSPSTTNPFPLLDGPGVIRVVSSPAAVGDYTVNVTGLASDTQYSYRGYVISDLGTFYTPLVATFTTTALPPVTLPTVTSLTSTLVNATAYNLGATVTSNGGSPITETGVVYSITSTNDNPFIGGAGVTKRATTTPSSGTFTVSITGLAASTTYSFRAYATNSLGTTHTTAIGTFTTATLPVINTPTATNVASTSATLGGNVVSGGGIAVLQRGVVFSSTNANPVIGGAGVTTFAASSSGIGVFTVNATGLLANTLYRYKAYAINSVGTSYTTTGTFTTSSTGAVPTLASPTITSLTSTSVTVGANVTGDGQSTITERGFVYSESSVNGNPVVGGAGVTKVVVPGGPLGTMSTTITPLLPNTSYTFKAFATNAVGTAYGAPFAFFTTLPPLTVTSPTVSDVTASSAILGGTVVSDSGTTVDERGVIYSTDSTVPPVIGGPGVTKVVATGSMGPFTVEAPGLSPETQYFFRAYATNSSGTSYSEISGFTTLPLVLLGASEVEWLTVEPPQAAPVPGEEPPVTQEAAAITRVPLFVYEKDEAELADPMIYTIEISEDSANWQPAEAEHWSVEEDANTIRASWISPDAPPSRLFFRVKATLASP